MEYSKEREGDSKGVVRGIIFNFEDRVVSFKFVLVFVNLSIFLLVIFK